MASLRLVNVSRRFSPGSYALREVSLEVQDREVVTILGPSGCGKSTLLRIIAGLDRPTSGEVWIGERRADGIPAKDRDIAMVFQSYALYPHMTCYENLALNLKLKRIPAAEIERRVHETARMLDIEDLIGKKPRELSGGQRQRVALGRALIRKPRIFLFDEPLSNLDALLRDRVRHELKELFARLQATVIYVTHDQVEATTLADRTVVLDRGIVQQIASPEALYRRPANIFVASFVGAPAMNLLETMLEKGQFRLGERLIPTGIDYTGGAVVGIRPESIRLKPGGPASVALVENLGSLFLVKIRIADQSLMVLSDQPPASNTLQLRIDPGDIHVFDTATGRNLRFPDGGDLHP